MEDLKSLHDQALQAAEQAKKAVEQNAQQVQTKLAERSKLLTQLEQAKMQEQVSASLIVDVRALRAGHHAEPQRGPRQDRGALRQGARPAELAQNSVEGRMREVQESSLDMAGASRLEQIRASMAGNQLSAPPTGAPTARRPSSTATPPLTSGTSTPATPAAEADADKAP